MSLFLTVFDRNDWKLTSRNELLSII